MPRGKQDLFARVRRQAEKALALLNAEIHRTEVELRKLLQQAQVWREAIGGVGPRTTRGRGRRAAAAPATRGRRAAGGKRVDWDQVLAAVPDKFGVDDILKHPGARAKGRAQAYPALTRWVQAKKIKKIDKGRYQKV